MKLILSHKSVEQQTVMFKSVTVAGLRASKLRFALFGHTRRRIGAEITQMMEWQALLLYLAKYLAALERCLVRDHCGGFCQLILSHIPLLLKPFLTAVTQLCSNVDILNDWNIMMDGGLCFMI
ncbi:hypothetical protein DD237_005066 [Peronospora effusa]|uniref:Uncharacterized protein n=1 Tax=Peronospora effusa TaxID=542832 RepID=A0A425CBM6_9STRA|nr:hypothetical protein DD237_005066 [Peronospora effusa]